MQINKLTTQITKSVTLTLFSSALFTLAACVDLTKDNRSDTSTVNLSGKWQYEQITSDPETQEFITSHYHVNLVDDGRTVSVQHCLKSMNSIFSRTHDVLINSLGQKLHIVDEDVIESVSVPDMRKLTRTNSNATDFHNAGTVSLLSNAIPTVAVDTEVCGQRIQQVGSNKIHLRVSIPFEDSYMEIEMEVDDINETPHNIDRMTLYSPSLNQYYDTYRLDSLYGVATFTTISNNRITLDFDMTTAVFNIFPGDKIQGTIDLHL